LISEGAIAGELYKTYSNKLYYSDTYGTDFMQKNNLVDLEALTSGYTPGEVYSSVDYIIKYSIDYGENFVEQGVSPCWVRSMSVGHSSGELYCGCHLGDVYYSDDYGETFEHIIDLETGWDLYLISWGSEPGEIYFYGENNRIYYSPNYGDTVYEQHQFDFFDWMQASGLTGGFTPGEIYVLETFIDLYAVGDTYLHHSTDYGQTFTPYHVSSNHFDTLCPQPVNDLTCTPSDSSIFLEWSPIAKNLNNQTEEVPYYVVYRNLDPDFEPSTADSIGYADTNSYIDLNSRWSTQAYYYVVKAVDDSGNKSEASNKAGRFNHNLIN